MQNSTKAKPETAVAVTSFQPLNDVPDKAPAPKFDPTNPNLTFDDVQPANYFSMESLAQWLEERGAESRILTIVGASTEYIYDPEKGVETGEWKPCLSFEETDTLLVINVTRNGQMKKLTGSPFMRDWAKAGQIAIKPGIGNGKAQIIITAVPTMTSQDVDDMVSYG